MDYADKRIVSDQISKRIGKAVFECINEYSIDELMDIIVAVGQPTCYVDDNGKAHNGRLITVSVDFMEDEDDDDDDY